MNTTTLLKIWTVAVLFFINLLNYMDRYTVAGVLPEIQNRTRNGFNQHIDDKEGGLLQTSFILTFMLLSPLFGYLGDRYTRKYIMAVGIFIWSGFVLLGSFSVNYIMLIATRCAVGIGEASYATIAPTILADLFSTEKRLRALAIFYMAIPIGSALGYGVGSFVSSQIHKYYHVTQSWRWAFRVSPGLGILAVLLVLFTIKEPPRGQSEDPRNQSGVKGQSGIKGYIDDVFYLLKNKTFILTSFGFAALTFSVGALAQWAPSLIYRTSQQLYMNGQLSHPYNTTDASLRFGIITVVAGLVATVSGSELSKFLSRWTKQSDCIVCAISLMIGGPFLYFTLWFGSYNLYVGWVMVFISEFFLCLMWAPVAAILLYVVIPECRSSAEAIQIFLIHFLGDAASPFIVGAISDSLFNHFHKSYNDIYSHAVSMQYSLYVTPIICVIGGGLFMLSTLTVENDRKAVEDHVKKVNSRSHWSDSDVNEHQSLSNDVNETRDKEDDPYHNDTSEVDKLLPNNHTINT